MECLATVVVVLLLAAPSLSYPYTRPRIPDADLADYLGGYAGDEMYGMPDYPASPRYTYASQRPRVNKEAMEALLKAAIEEYMDYNTYSDNDGTWYDDTAMPDLPQPAPRDDSNLMQLLFHQRPASSAPLRYSLEDLENMERTAAREDNTENQLHALTEKMINKKSIMPMLGSRVAVAPLRQGQQEETFDIPATSVRRPVYARTITTYPEQAESERRGEDMQPTYSQTTDKPEGSKVSGGQSETSTSGGQEGSGTPASEQVGVPRAAETPYLRERYETFRNFLDQERKARQDRDDRQREERRAPHKRFITEQESLRQQLTSLKKTMA